MSDSVEAAVAALRECGIDRPEQYAALAAPDRILETCRWWQKQNGRVGTGVLVTELRAGGKPAAAKPLLDAQYDYGESIVQWLRKHFPEWNHDDGNRTHSAAIAEVIRLHHRDGKNALTPSKHGPEIRAAVNAFNERYL